MKDMIKPAVRQEDDFGCGFACIAYICDMNYQDVKKCTDNADKAKTGSYRCKFLADTLNRIYKENKIEKIWKTKYVGKTKNPKIPSDSIVYISKNYKYKYGHYIVKTDQGYMNPFVNVDKVDSDVRLSIAKFERSMCGAPSLIITTENIKYEKDF